MKRQKHNVAPIEIAPLDSRVFLIFAESLDYGPNDLWFEVFWEGRVWTEKGISELHLEFAINPTVNRYSESLFALLGNGSWQLFVCNGA